MIDNMKNSPLNLQATSVYNFNDFTLTELLNKFFSKINECVDVSNESLNFLTWLKGEGLPNEVVKELEIMYQDGRLTTLINELGGNLTEQLETFKTEQETKFNTFESETEQTLDTFNVSIQENVDEIEQINNSFSTPFNFGAKGDGITDDTTSLQNWLDDNSKNKVLPYGVFLTKTLNVNSDNNSIISTGGILKSNGTTELFIINGKNNTISIEINGNNNLGVGILNKEYNIIENCKIYDLYSNTYRCVGIETTSINGSIIRNNIIKNIISESNNVIGDILGATRGIYFNITRNATKETIIESNYIENILGEEGDAIQIFSSSGTTPYLNSLCTVRNNTIINCNRRAIKVQASRTDVLNNIHKNTLTSEYLASSNNLIDIVSSNDCKVIGNILDAREFLGIASNGSATSKNTNVIIKNNIIKGGFNESVGIRQTNNGIYYNYNENLLIDNNTIYDGVVAISGNNSTNTLITNNTLIGGVSQTSVGIRIYNTEFVIIKNNELVNGNRLYMIQFGGKAIVKNNTGIGCVSLVRNADLQSVGSIIVNNFGNSTGTLIAGDYTNQFTTNNVNIGTGVNGNGIGFIGTSLGKPTSNSHVKGELLINQQGGGVFGWRCIASGNPGTWEEIDLRTLSTSV